MSGSDALSYNLFTFHTNLSEGNETQCTGESGDQDKHDELLVFLRNTLDLEHVSMFGIKSPLGILFYSKKHFSHGILIIGQKYGGMLPLKLHGLTSAVSK